MNHISQRNRNIFLIRIYFHKGKIIGGFIGLIAVSVYFLLDSPKVDSFSLEVLAWSVGLSLFGMLIGSIADVTFVGINKPSHESGTADPKMAFDKSSTNGCADLGGGE